MHRAITCVGFSWVRAGMLSAAGDAVRWWIAFLLVAGCRSPRGATPSVVANLSTDSGLMSPRVVSTSGSFATMPADDDLSWLEPVYFTFDSVELSVATRGVLERLHHWLVAHPTATLLVEGHCDEQGTTEYNIALGQRRAQALTDFLVRLGTDARRINSISYGAERPVAGGHDESAWARNRRGEFRVTR